MATVVLHIKAALFELHDLMMETIFLQNILLPMVHF